MIDSIPNFLNTMKPRLSPRLTTNLFTAGSASSFSQFCFHLPSHSLLLLLSIPKHPAQNLATCTLWNVLNKPDPSSELFIARHSCLQPCFDFFFFFFHTHIIIMIIISLPLASTQNNQRSRKLGSLTLVIYANNSNILDSRV